jgi:hypothetical protein
VTSRPSKWPPAWFKNLLAKDSEPTPSVFVIEAWIHWKVGRLGAFENFFNVAGGPTVKIGLTCSVGQEAARFDILPQSIYRRQPVAGGKVADRPRDHNRFVEIEGETVIFFSGS